MKVTFRIDGMKELKRYFAEMPQAARSAGRAGMRQAAKIGASAAQAAAPVDTGLLKSEVYATSASLRDLKEIKVTVGAKVSIRPVRKKYTDNAANRRSGKAGKGYSVDGPAYYGKFLEFGYHDRGGNWHPGRFWMTRSFKGAATAMLSEFVRTFRPQLEKASARIAKRNALKVLP